MTQTRESRLRIERPYGIRHARRALPHLGIATIQDWRRRGIISCGTKRSGRLEYVIFSDEEITDLEVVSELSAYGVLKARRLHFLIGWPQPQLVKSLTNPVMRIQAYRDLGYEAAFVFYVIQEKPESLGERPRRTPGVDLQVNGHLIPADDAREELRDWLSPQPALGGAMRSGAFVSVKRIDSHVRRELGLKPRPALEPLPQKRIIQVSLQKREEEYLKEIEEEG